MSRLPKQTPIDAAPAAADPYALPPFSDPAFSVRPAASPVRADAPDYPPPPEDTEFIGHPGFSAKAAKNKPPDGIGLGERVDETDGKTGSRKERH